MKRLILIALFSTCMIGLYAQGEVGSFSFQPKVGMNVSHLVSTRNSPTIGLAAGFEWEYQVAERVGLSFAIMFSMQGVKPKNADGFVLVNEDGYSVYEPDVTFKLNYIQIPFLVNGYVAKGLAFKLGIQCGIKTCANYKFNNVKTIQDSQIVDVKGELSELGIETKDYILSIPVGVSYEFHNIVLECRYNIGVSKFFSNINVNNNVFQFTIGMKFGR